MEKIVVGAIIGLLIALLLRGISAAKSKISESISRKDYDENPKGISARLRFAKSHFGKNDDVAKNILEDLLSDDPSNYEATVLLGILYHLEENVAESGRLFQPIIDGNLVSDNQEKIVVGNYENGLAIYCMAHLLYLQEEVEKAESLKTYVNDLSIADSDLADTVQKLNYF